MICPVMEPAPSEQRYEQAAAMSAARLAALIRLVREGTVSHQAAKRVYAELARSEEEPQDAAARLGLVQVSDQGVEWLQLPIVIAQASGAWTTAHRRRSDRPPTAPLRRSMWRPAHRRRRHGCAAAARSRDSRPRPPSRRPGPPRRKAQGSNHHRHRRFQYYSIHRHRHRNRQGAKWKTVHLHHP